MWKICSAFCSASESNKQNLPGRSLDSSLFFRYELVILIKTTFLVHSGFRVNFPAVCLNSDVN